MKAPIGVIVSLWIINLNSVECAFDTDDCGVTKSCVRNTPGCSLSDAGCLFFSYAWDPSTSTFLMEMSGGSGNEEQYNGVAFSPNGQMLNSDAYFCIGTEVLSGVIRARGNPPVLDSSLTTEITITTASTMNGVAECTFRRPENIQREVSDSMMRNFSLRAENFFILQAVGRYNSSQTPSPLTYHEQNGRWRTSQAFNFSEIRPAEALTTPAPSPTPSPPTRYCDNTGKYTPTCFFLPSGCTPLGDSPCLFATWNVNSEAGTVDIEIIGGSAGQYVAFAFGTVERMEDADLYYCTERNVFSGAIRELRMRPTVLEEATGVSNPTSGLENGIIRCSFTRPLSVTKEVSNNRSVNFNVLTERYYLLLASGTITDGELQYHSNSVNARGVSDFVIDFNSGKMYTANFYAILALQILMLFYKLM